MSEGGGLYLMHDTCDEFKEDYGVPRIGHGSSCGYHVRTNKGTQVLKCESLASRGICPSGARIWPKVGSKEGRRLLSQDFRQIHWHAPPHQLAGAGMWKHADKVGTVRFRIVSLCQCKPRLLQYALNRSCIPCHSSDGGDDSQRSDNASS